MKISLAMVCQLSLTDVICAGAQTSDQVFLTYLQESDYYFF